MLLRVDSDLPRAVGRPRCIESSDSSPCRVNREQSRGRQQAAGSRLEIGDGGGDRIYKRSTKRGVPCCRRGVGFGWEPPPARELPPLGWFSCWLSQHTPAALHPGTRPQALLSTRAHTSLARRLEGTPCLCPLIARAPRGYARSGLSAVRRPLTSARPALPLPGMARSPVHTSLAKEV